MRRTSFGHKVEFSALCVDHDQDDRGLGRALFEASRNATRMRSPMLWVLAENPRRGFCERMDGRAVGEREEDVGGVQLAEVAVGWPARASP